MRRYAWTLGPGMADNPDGEYVRYEDLLPIDTREALRDRATELDGLKI